MKIETLEITIARLSKDFYIQAEPGICQGHPCYEFWLCRQNYGIRTSLFGVPTKGCTLVEAFKTFEPTFQDFESMSGFYDDLLEECEYVDPKTLTIYKS